MKASWNDLPKVTNERGHVEHRSFAPDLMETSKSIDTPNLPPPVSKMHKGFSTYTE